MWPAALKLTVSPTSGSAGREGEGGVRRGVHGHRAGRGRRARRQRRSRAAPRSARRRSRRSGSPDGPRHRCCRYRRSPSRTRRSGSSRRRSWRRRRSATDWPTLGRAGENTKDGTGGVFSAPTVTFRVVLVERPPESVTVSRTVCEPAVANGGSPARRWRRSSRCCRSPTRRRRSAARGRRPSRPRRRLTVWPTSGEAGEKSNEAVGGALTVTVCETVSGTPSASVTRSETVRAPAEGYELLGVMPSASSNCPSLSKSQA